MGTPDPPGLAPRVDSLAFEGTSVLSCTAPFARTVCGEPWWSGESTGHKIFGPTRRTSPRQGGVQEVNESASCVAARNAGSLPSAGTAGTLGVSAGATRALHRAYWSLGVVPLTADGFARLGSGRTRKRQSK
jgi:hypothetical protein